MVRGHRVLTPTDVDGGVTVLNIAMSSLRHDIFKTFLGNRT